MSKQTVIRQNNGLRSSAQSFQLASDVPDTSAASLRVSLFGVAIECCRTFKVQLLALVRIRLPVSQNEEQPTYFNRATRRRYVHQARRKARSSVPSLLPVWRKIARRLAAPLGAATVMLGAAGTTGAQAQSFANLCSGFQVKLPALAATSGALSSAVTGVLGSVPVLSALTAPLGNAIGGVIDENIVTALSGKTIGVDLLSGTSILTPANCGVSATDISVANNLTVGNRITLNRNAGISFGGGSITGLGGTGNLAATATDVTGIAIGNNALTSAGAANAIAVGVAAQATATGAVAIGNTALAQGGKAVSIGVGNIATGNGAVAIGDPNLATGTGAVALGADNTATGTGAVALGNTSNATADGAVALGNNAISTYRSSVAIGTATRASGSAVQQGVTDFRTAGNPNGQIVNAPLGTLTTTPSGVAIGENSVVNVGGGVALGFNNNAGSTTGVFSTAIGANNLASGSFGSAIGTNNTASGASSVALGVNNTASGLRAVAIGRQALATGDFGIAQGFVASAYGLNAVAVGANSVAGLVGGLTINDVAIGPNASATAGNSVALGAGSTATRLGLVGAEAFSLAAVASPNGAVSVGAAGQERQITNVAGGTLATDAVNLRQLRSVATNVATTLGSNFDGTTGAYTPPVYTVNGTPYNTVTGAIAALATTPGMGAFVSNNAGLPPAAAPVATGLNASAGGFGSRATGAGSTVVGNGATDNGSAGAVAIGQNAASTSNLNGLGSVAIGQNTTATGGVSPQNVFDFRSGPGILKQINNLPDGTTTYVPTGVAIGSLSTVRNGGGVAIGYNNRAGGTDQAQSSTAIGSNNLASGVNSIAFGLNNTASNRGSIAVGTDNQATGLRSIAMGREAYAYGDFSSAQGYLASAYGVNSIALGPNSVAGVNGGPATNDIALGSGATSSFGNSVALGAGSIAGRGAQAAYTGYAVGPTTSVGELAVGTVAAARTITGVSAGTAATDAVNVSQLNTVGNAVAGSLGGGAAFNSATGTYTPPAFVTALGTGANTVQEALANETAAITALGTGTATKLGGGTTYNPATGAIDGGFTVNGTTYADVAAAVSGAAATGGVIQRTATGNQVAVTASGGTGTAPGTAQVITNVAAGTIAAGSTQAVNGSQLNTTNTQVTANTTAVTNLTNGAAGPFRSNNANNRAAPAATGTDSVAGGFGATDNGVANSTVLGNGATVAAGVTGSNVALGQNSTVAIAAVPVAGATIGGNAYTFAGTLPVGAVSVGTAAGARQIQNVAAGQLSTSSTDAVNGSQLNATNTQVTANTTAITGINNGTVGVIQRTATAGTVAVTAPTGTGTAPGAAQVVTNVAVGAVTALSTDAVNGSQLFNTNTAVGTVTAQTTALGNATAAGFGGTSTYTAAGGLTAPSYNVYGTPQANVGAAITALQTAAPVQFSNATGTVTQQTPSNNVTLVGAAGGAPVALHNVAAGTLATDAVNLAQLTGAITAGAAPVRTGDAGPFTTTATGAGSLAVGSNAIAGVGSTVIGTGATDNANVNATVLGNGASVAANVAGSNVALGQGSAVTVAATAVPNATIAGTTYTFAGAAPTGAVSVGAVNAERQIQNVAAGRLTAGSTDAVNGSQLFATTQAVTSLANGTAGLVQQDAATRAITVGAGTDGASVAFANNVGAARTLTGVAVGQVAAGSTEGVNGGQLYATAQSVSTALGGGSTVTGGQVTAPAYALSSGTYNNVGAALTAIDNGQVGAFRSNNAAGAVAPVATGPNATAGGFGSSATGAASTVIGNAATDNAVANSTVLGNGASVAATAAGSNVALGQNSVASVGARTNYAAFGLAAPQNSVGTVSVGAVGTERTISNVAAGVLGTDAANVAQLSGATTALGASVAAKLGGGTTADPATGQLAGGFTVNGTTYTDVASAVSGVAATGGVIQRTATANDVAITDPTGSGAAPGTAQTLSNLAAGTVSATSTQAVNGSQLFGTAQSLATRLGGGAGVNADGTVSAPVYTVAGNNYGNVGDALAAGNRSAVQYSVNGAGDPLSAIDLTKGNTLAPVSMTGLANATTATGAVTLGQLPIQYTDAAGTPTPATPSNTVGLVGGAAGPVTLANLAAGTVAAGSTQAVNGSQLFGTAQSVSSALGGGSAVNPDGTVAAPTYNVAGTNYTNVGAALTAIQTDIAAGTLGSFVADNTAGNAIPVASGANATAGGYGASATGAGSTAIGNSAIDNGVANSTVLGSGATIAAGLTGSNVALGQGSVATTGAQANYAAFGLAAPQTSVGTVSVGTVGGERTISNVAAGVAGTDAVNVAQLSGAAANLGSSVATGLGGGATYNATTGQITGPTYTVGGKAYTDVGSAITAGNALGVQYTADANGNPTSAIDLTKGGTLAPATLSGLAPGALTATSTDAVNGSQLYATNQTVANLASGRGGAFAADNTSGQAVPAATGADSAAGGFGALASGTRSLALGSGAASSGTNSVALGAGSTDGGIANVVSVGAAGAERRITNVAAGVSATDAANTGQLTALAARSLQYDTTATGQTNYQSVTLNPTGSGPVTIHNVAPGLALTDAVNVSQLGAATANSVQYATNADGTRSNTLALMGGTAGAPVTISNVAAGVAATDAVNVGQLQGALNGQYNNLAQIGDYQFRSAKQTAYAGTSIALATAGIRYDDRPGKISLGLGASGYHGSAGLAVGIGGTSEDGKWRINVSAGFSPNNQKGAAGIMGGASYTFN
ncbi:hypothetical protein [Methylobacterium thuringiense]|uniref:Uncharacterized protein n=1 Tax=Methylobacterium thuringiense TaxID=1003091 RepID=A0ABQ4TRP1_9HYPH|nr:hypothetical protein [Methylobacterium thuringiense]GJE57820.1 hypothetical protein EKPJFOCH_4340 [Methylobacterium thuringiense]